MNSPVAFGYAPGCRKTRQRTCGVVSAFYQFVQRVRRDVGALNILAVSDCCILFGFAGACRGILTAAGTRRVAAVKVSPVLGGSPSHRPWYETKQGGSRFCSKRHPRRDRSGDGCIRAVMPEYRVYPLSAGRLARPTQVLVCENDREAIEKTKRLMNGHAEVWDGARFVATIRPRGPERAGS
jgi:hypothetical protein